MTKPSLNELVGFKISKLLAIFFRSVDGEVAEPSSVTFRRSSGDMCELLADGNGGVKFYDYPLETLFFDKAVGYSFVAPLLIVFDGLLDGSERIDSIRVSEELNKTCLILCLDNSMYINLQFEDDELYICLSGNVEAKSMS